MSQGPAIPAYILRGHVAPIHALLFLNSNLHLASGDSDGWVVVWSLASKRPIGVWKGHGGGVSGIKSWDQDRLITHGRDHKLRVWQINYADSRLNTKLPVDGAGTGQPKPWLLHSMDISALNFCAFATCEEPRIEATPPEDECDLLIASPNGLDSGGIDIFQLPSQRRVSQLASNKSNNTGMVMAISLFYTKDNGSLCMASGYEDGRVMVHCHQGILDPSISRWETLMTGKAHSQPVLSLSLSPSKDYFITSSADAQIAKFSMPSGFAVQTTPASPLKSIITKHAGQQSISMRSDGKIFATAGWDARVRVYSAKTMKELAVLKWHKDGCYSTAFADIMHEGMLESVQSIGESSQDLADSSALNIIKQERSLKAQRMHWIAAGGKDGKISLWDIY